MTEGAPPSARDERALLGRLLYGLLFVAVLPLLLVVWARALAPVVQLPVPTSAAGGTALLAAGLGLIVSGWLALWRHGRGLPMNAFPPERFVDRGVYCYLSHPIYVGFVLACAGASIAVGSPSGLWVVTPTAAAGCAALVYGYERADLRTRFGDALPLPRVRLAAATDVVPDFWERLSAWLLVLIPWATLYEAVGYLGLPRDARQTYLPFERSLPILPWTELIYGSAYPFAVLAPWFAARKRDLRAFEVRGLLAMGLVFPIYLALPWVAPDRPFAPHGWLGALLQLERAWSAHGAAAFPSFHVIWALLAAELYASRATSRAGKGLWRLWGGLITASCVTTGMHSLADVLSGCAVAWAVAHAGDLWGRLQRGTERLANSWREWRVGPARIINHGGYIVIGMAGALVIAGSLAGDRAIPAAFFVAACGLVASALWAQLVEGSPQLMRPYGYYGGLLGTILGSALVGPLFGVNGWILLCAFAVAGPWVQSFGRLRCLVQGCCHGAPTSKRFGIRYRHPRSRVTRLAGLGNVPLHPTQLYAILWNLPIALAVTRLWSLDLPVTVPGGVYLLLNGLGRFVEESYRGEPQTPRVAGLRLYQWTALTSALAGAAMMALPGAPRSPPLSLLPASSVLAAVAFALLFGFALGVDFPESNRRFSRLA